MLVVNRWNRIVIVLCVLSTCALAGAKVLRDAKGARLLQLPDATLLLGWGDVDYLAATTKYGSIIQVLPYPRGPVVRGYGGPILSTISANGNIVACVRVEQNGANRAVVATYSLSEDRWTDYGRFGFAGMVAISPSGSKLAFPASDEGNKVRLFVLDTKTRDQFTVSWVDEISIYDTLSWAPDEKRLVHGRGSKDINIIDLARQTSSKVGIGKSPAWSPSGEWIALYDVYGRECRAIHPDGSGEHVLFDFGHKPNREGHGVLGLPPVWSPDSSKLIADEEWSSEMPRTILMYDLNARRVKKVMDGVSVLGWAASK